MALSENNIELLEQYLAGNLDEDQKIEVAQRLKGDPEFKAAYEELKTLTQGIRYHKSLELLGQLRDTEKTFTKQAAKRQAEIVKMQPWKRIITLAAVLAGIILGAYLLYIATKTDATDTSLYASYFEAPSAPEGPATRGKPQVYNDAYNSYKKGDHGSAINQFEEYLSLQSDPDAAFFLAISYLVEEQPREAIKVLEDIRAEGFEYSDDAKWYLALAYIKTGQRAKAVPILDQLSNSSSKYAGKASEVLDEL